MPDSLKILFITYDFPPRGGAAVQRTLKFLKYLPRFNCQPTVLTLKTGNYMVMDKSLLDELSPKLDVYRVRELPGRISDRVLNKFNIKFKPVFPDVACRWILPAVYMGVKLIRSNSFLTIYTTSPPHSVHLAGYLIKKLTKVSWIADFRDTWSQNPYFVPPRGLRRLLHEKLEQKVVENATKVLTNTEEALLHFQTIHPHAKEKIICLPNGFDPEDFPEKPKEEIKRNKLVMSYVGSLGERRMDFFFKALRNFLNKNPDKKNKLEIIFAGMPHPPTEELARQYDLADIVSFKGHLPHRQAIDLMMLSDVLLIFQFSNHGGATAIPGKFYEYMGAKKTIWAQTCDGPTKNIALKYKGALCSNSEDIFEIENVLSQLFERYNNNELRDIKDDGIGEYSRVNLTGKLVGIISAP
jgi:glycosyltransferase involved in cell wall biosynthesis